MQSTEMVDYTLVREETSAHFSRTSIQELKVADQSKDVDFWWRSQSVQDIRLNIEALPAKPFYEASKRLMDISISFILLLLCLPIFVIIAIAIRADSRGPILFKQTRIGKGGNEFQIYKFRTMVADAETILKTRKDLQERFNADFKIKNDPRITRVGAFLRKTSLDETPQFINVLKGDISLIGPRAVVREELPRYGDSLGKVLAVPAGLSGWWQVRGRTDTTYTERVQMDVQYVEQRSLWLDIKLIFETAISVLKCRGAY